MTETNSHSLSLFILAIFRKLAGKWVFLMLRILNMKLLREAKALAIHLELDVFPALQEAGQDWITLHVSEGTDLLVLSKTKGKAEQNLPGTERIAQLYYLLGLTGCRLDTRLESNQILDALLVLLRAGKYLSDAIPNDRAEFSWNAKQLAIALVSGEGVRKFCARMSYSQREKICEIEYSYCELTYSRLLNDWIKRYSDNKDHRALFFAAPWIGCSVSILLFVSFLSVGSIEHYMALSVLVSVVAGILMWYLIFTIGSILYDREHRDALLKENLLEITALSHFPINNPNPVMKFDGTGQLLYMNPATEELLAELGFSSEAVEEILPDDFPDLARRYSEKRLKADVVETTRHGRTLRYNISVFPVRNAVLLAGADITQIKQLERELREWNETLESRVRERTHEVLVTQDATILALSSLAEVRDPETGAHIERTRSYVKVLAEHLQTHSRFRDYLDSPDTIDLLYRSAPLHDIGKVGIPDHILLKPGKLTAEEFEMMKTHTTNGGDSLRQAEEELGENSFLHCAREIAYHHHEKWDGSGYPFGLVGEEIPISARLMALADVYDALICKRVYKDAMSHDKARSIILEGKGRHFDPDIADAFLLLENKFQSIAEEYIDEE